MFKLKNAKMTPKGTSEATFLKYLVKNLNTAYQKGGDVAPSWLKKHFSGLNLQTIALNCLVSFWWLNTRLGILGPRVEY